MSNGGTRRRSEVIERKCLRDGTASSVNHVLIGSLGRSSFFEVFPSRLSSLHPNR